jgi:hypothetical protein
LETDLGALDDKLSTNLVSLRVCKVGLMFCSLRSKNAIPSSSKGQDSTISVHT